MHLLSVDSVFIDVKSYLQIFGQSDANTAREGKWHVTT